MKVFNKRIFWFLTVAVLSMPVFSFANSKAVGAEKKQTVAGFSAEKASELDNLFYGGLKSFNDGNISEAAEKFQLMRDKSSAGGYTNIASHSIKLLEQAGQAFEKKDKKGGEFLLTWAERFSPSDSRVSFVKSSLVSQIGYSSSFNEITKGMGNLDKNPSLTAAIILNVILGGLVGLTLSLFLVLAIQIGRNSQTLVENISRFLPINYRGLLGPFLTLSILVLPLYFGLLVGLAVWALLLGAFLKSCKKLFILVGLVIICWGTCLSFVDRVGGVLGTASIRAVENLRNSNFSIEDKAALSAEIERNPNNYLVQYAFAGFLAKEGLLVPSQKMYSKVIANTKERDSLHQKALVNKGIVLTLSKKNEEAISVLEKAFELGDTSFESYLAMAQAQMSLLDTVEHGKYYNLAREADSEKLKAHESKGENSNIVLSSLSSNDLLWRIFKSASVESGEVNESTAKVYKSLLMNGNKTLILILGLMTLCLGFLVSKKEKRHKTASDCTSPFLGGRISTFWNLFPCGKLVAGSYPTLGAIVLGTILSLAIFAAKKPISFIPISVQPLNLGWLFVAMSLSLLLLTLLLSPVLEKTASSNGGI